ncbi:MAG: hypothetical protein U5L02_02880, partial [Rheinheimera sp.]|nr:hypothetical protein [Rheinheimera sp.]
SYVLLQTQTAGKILFIRSDFSITFAGLYIRTARNPLTNPAKLYRMIQIDGSLTATAQVAAAGNYVRVVYPQFC